jgi:hypothetical protein
MSKTDPARPLLPAAGTAAGAGAGDFGLDLLADPGNSSSGLDKLTAVVLCLL